jgi:hypothetical protein
VEYTQEMGILELERGIKEKYKSQDISKKKIIMIIMQSL